MVTIFRGIKTILIVSFLFLIGGTYLHAQQTPVSQNGKLQVLGLKLCNQYGNPVQLRGMSTHGIQWYYQCLTEESLNALATDWGADILRISLYVQEGGYETNPKGFTDKVKWLVNEATERGMYALIDWHQLDPGDPNYNLAKAKTFFTDVATTFKDYNNVIYDICNEPNSCTWAAIKKYADIMIPHIRAIDSDAVIFVGTHGWGSMGISDGRNAKDIVDNPLEFKNIMYTFHFYAKSHRDVYLQELDWASDRLPVFVTEFGSQEYTGDGPNDFSMTKKYIDLMAKKKIGWTNWNFSDDGRTGAVWKTGTAPNGPWDTTRLKEAGLWIRDKILHPADDFPGIPDTSPKAPVNLHAVSLSSSSVTMCWDDSSDNESQFVIEASSDSMQSWQEIDSAGQNFTSFVLQKLQPQTTYFLRVKSKNYKGTSTYSNIVEATTFENGYLNLALNKNSTTSSVLSSGFVAKYLNDGNVASRWESLSDSLQNVTLDLGALYSMKKVRILWDTVFAQKYKIELSRDNKTFSEKISEISSNGGLDEFLMNDTARYIRIQCISKPSLNGYSIREFQVLSNNTKPIVITRIDSKGKSADNDVRAWFDSATGNIHVNLTLVKSGFVHASVVDLNGRTIDILTKKNMKAGNYNFIVQQILTKGMFLVLVKSVDSFNVQKVMVH